MMLCQKCGLSEATVHRETMVFRQKIEEHLCELCASIGITVPTKRQRGHVSRVTSTTSYSFVMADKDGNPLGPPQAVLDPLPEMVPVPNGLAALPDGAARLFASTGSDACF